MSENVAARADVPEAGYPDPLIAPAPAEPLIEVAGVVKHWPKMSAPVLAGVNLNIPHGRFVALTGRNGVGKTTLLRIIASIIEPDAGFVRIEGLNPLRQRRQFNQRIGFLSAGHSGLFARLTVRQHMEYWARLALLSSEARLDAITRTAAAFELGELIAKRVDRLSAGQRQRVRLALTFLHGPRVVLLDEPRNSLDAEAAALLLGEIERFTRSGGSVVWCAPSADEVGTHADNVFTLRDGELVPQ
jgi:ABC-type multidrug transport system ATPase subunit